MANAPAWPEAIPVAKWMTAPAVTIRAAAPAREAVELMRARRIRHLPVVDEAGRLVGIVTDRDLRQMVFDPAVQERLAELGEVLQARTVAEVMTWGVVTVAPTTGIRAAARLHDVLRAFEQLVRERVAGVRPLAVERAVAGIYEYGFPEPSRGEPWENEGASGH